MKKECLWNFVYKVLGVPFKNVFELQKPRTKGHISNGNLVDNTFL